MTCSAGSVASYFVSNLHHKECTAQSLVKALDTFLKEVHEMRDVIMVPNRLRGVPMPKVDDQKFVGANGTNGRNRTSSMVLVNKPSISQRAIADTMALLPVGSRALLPYSDGINGFIATQGFMQQDSLGVDKNNNNPKFQSAEKEDFAWPEDLFRRYRVVQALRRELMTDPDSSVSSNTSSTSSQDEDADDEQTRILAARFRQYLSGLFEILDQLTVMTKHLSKWYQDEIDPKREV